MRNIKQDAETQDAGRGFGSGAPRGFVSHYTFYIIHSPFAFVRHLALALAALATLMPFFVMLLFSLKDFAQTSWSFWSPPSPWRWENYGFALKASGAYVGNSLIVSAGACSLALLAAVPAAHAFSALAAKWSSRAYALVVAMLMVPNILLLVPLFLVTRSLGLLDSYLGLILPQAAGMLPVTIFLLKESFDGIPRDLFDAARIDGAGEARVIAHIVVPMSMPIFSSVCILNLLASWNNYVWPLITTQTPALRTIPLGLAFLVTEQNLMFEPGKLMATYAVASVPLVVFFLIAMKPFVRGLASGALKE
ncbi:hypothetical protein AW736_17170 [Termitidicoccus mucosus]|uniref:ABC transmembrane type-1 domain-containing protein n=1 Tax=Termitidicoccus mucosus TaxID=1184151 RepID=A0A178IEY3_9BACT|nr:hypothetical protein AW736_17170 [Opitutaceae bacterium TSB47]